jgi:hypothetical protein
MSTPVYLPRQEIHLRWEPEAFTWHSRSYLGDGRNMISIDHYLEVPNCDRIAADEDAHTVRNIHRDERI